MVHGRGRWSLGVLAAIAAGACGFPRREDLDTTALEAFLRASRADRLVAVTAVGRAEALPVVTGNLDAHFRADRGWACVAFVFPTREALGDEVLRPLAQRCFVLRWPGAGWGQFLRLLSPPLVAHFATLALLLDDVSIPAHGPRRVAVEDLLRLADARGIDVLSPAVRGGMHPVVADDETRTSAVYRAYGFEIFFTLFSARAWACLYRMFAVMDEAEWRGLDTCFHRVCPNHTIAVDRRVTVRHMEAAALSAPTHRPRAQRARARRESRRAGGSRTVGAKDAGLTKSGNPLGNHTLQVLLKCPVGVLTTAGRPWLDEAGRELAPKALAERQAWAGVMKATHATRRRWERQHKFPDWYLAKPEGSEAEAARQALIVPPS